MNTDRIISRHGLDCVENCMTTLLYRKHLPFALCFSQAHMFYYHSSGTLIGERIDKGIRSISMIAEDLFGVIFEYKECADFQTMVKEIKDCTEKNETPFVFIDSFYCPWYPVYQKLHREHFCIVEAVCDNQDFICCDPIFEQVDAILPAAELSLCSRSYYRTTYYDKRFDKSVRGVMLKGIERFLTDRCPEQMRAFALDFESFFDFDAEFKELESYFFDVAFFQQLTYIGGGRELYAECLRCVSEMQNDIKLVPYANTYCEIAQKWHMVKGMLTKCYYSGFNREIQNRIAGDLRSISEMEERTAYQLWEYVK